MTIRNSNFGLCIRSMLILLLLLLLSKTTTTRASYTPFVGCKEVPKYSVPDGADCYAVDSYLCDFMYDTGCQQTTANYLYYIGGERRDGGQTFSEEIYQSVTVYATSNCGNTGNTPDRFCSVGISGQTTSCTTCSNVDPNNYKLVTLSDCDNLPNVFGSTPQTILVDETANGQHFGIVFNETRCQHPAITGRVRLDITGQLAYQMGTVAPTQADNGALISNTADWFNDLLPEHFPLFQILEMGPWRSFFRGGGGGGVLEYEYNATIIMDPDDKTTTVAALGVVMMNTTHMGWYVDSVVKPTSISTGVFPFETVTSATGTVTER